MLLELINNAISNSLVEVTEKLVREAKEELVRQGHSLTGQLEDSIRYELTQLPNVTQTIVFMANYGKYVDQGVKAANIPFQEGSGKKSSKYIDGLQRFWILKGLPEDEALSAAFATAKKHKKEGMPTRDSYRFSQNGKRKGFFSDTVTDLQDEIEQLGAIVGEKVRTSITNVIRRTVQEFETVELGI